MSRRAMSRRRTTGLLVVSAAALAVAGLLAWPSPIDPLSYEPVPGAPLEGVLAPNDALTRAELWGDGRLYVPEDIAFDSAGRLHTATGDGRLLRLTRGPDGVRRLA